MKLDDFLRVTAQNILSHAGKISHQTAIEKAQKEYQKQTHASMLSTVEKHFLHATKEIEKLCSGS